MGLIPPTEPLKLIAELSQEDGALDGTATNVKTISNP